MSQEIHLIAPAQLKHFFGQIREIVILNPRKDLVFSAGHIPGAISIILPVYDGPLMDGSHNVDLTVISGAVSECEDSCMGSIRAWKIPRAGTVDIVLSDYASSVLNSSRY